MRKNIWIIAFVLAATPVGVLLAQEKADLPDPDVEFSTASKGEIELGRLLFYDPILSGNRTVSCATCHHPRFGTSDGVSLSLGDGGVGLGPARRTDGKNLPEQRVPRNSPALFNLGAREFTRLFHDGRLEMDASRPSGIRTPLEDEMVAGFDNVLSAQAMFPVLSPDEMAGHYSENPVAQAVRLGQLTHSGGAWEIIAGRVDAVAEYRAWFADIAGTVRPLEFTDIANAIAAFIAFEWRANDSPFDKHLRGEMTLSEHAQAGMALFYGQAGCASCHSGLFQTDHDFHAIAMPQFGPGKAARFENHSRDTGRMRVTGREADAYRFRTPSLRNVALTAPYGHSGAHATLEAVVRHHLDPVASLERYDRTQAILPELPGVQDWRVLDAPDEVAAIAASSELAPRQLDDEAVAALLAFLRSLTDPVSLVGRLGVPDEVPSGLPVD